MAEPPAAAPAAPSGKGVFESFVDLIDVATDWSFILLVMLIFFRKQIGAHVSNLVKEVIKLISRLQSATVGGTTLVFSRSDLQLLATENDPELFRRIFMRTPVDTEPAEVDEPAEEDESEAEEFAAGLAEIRNQQVRENNP